MGCILTFMKEFDFPVFKTKIEGSSRKFNLEDPAERREYFTFKAGKEIEKLRDYLANGNTFVAILLGKKNSGKGTYSKLFMEAVGAEHVAHISVGDIVRAVHRDFSDEGKKKELLDFWGGTPRLFCRRNSSWPWWSARLTAWDGKRFLLMVFPESSTRFPTLFISVP